MGLRAAVWSPVHTGGVRPPRHPLLCLGVCPATLSPLAQALSPPGAVAAPLLVAPQRWRCGAWRSGLGLGLLGLITGLRPAWEVPASRSESCPAPPPLHTPGHPEPQCGPNPGSCPQGLLQFSLGEFPSCPQVTHQPLRTPDLVGDVWGPRGAELSEAWALGPPPWVWQGPVLPFMVFAFLLIEKDCK